MNAHVLIRARAKKVVQKNLAGYTDNCGSLPLGSNVRSPRSSKTKIKTKPATMKGQRLTPLGKYEAMADQTKTDWPQIAKHRWPQYHITGTGCLAVLLCHQVRLEELPIFAMATRRVEFGAGCCGTDRHRIVELKPPEKLTRTSKRWNAECQRD